MGAMSGSLKQPVAHGELGTIYNQTRIEVSDGIWLFDDDDWALIAMLQDPVYMSELLFGDPKNKDYGGCYHVMDYQYPLFRHYENYEGKPCARAVGKTESMKADGVCHAFRRQGEDMLVTAPELIHLDPLTSAIESRIRNTRLTSEFLDVRQGKTGFTHKPFQCDFLDGTKIYGRIPKLSGTGVKGMHEPDLRIEEAQDFPEKGWIEVTPTLMADHTDHEGRPDFSFVFYGVHSGARDTTFYRLASSGEFRITAITALMRPGWGPAEKAKMSAIYGGTQSPDYKRNVLGEAGGSSSAFFVTARLMACVDQDKESHYNTIEFKRQTFHAEQIDQDLGDMTGLDHRDRTERMMDYLRGLLDLPDMNSQQIHMGIDVGLVNDPTVITLWAVENQKGKSRLKLRRMFHLWHFREKQIRLVQYIIGFKYMGRLRSNGIDVTGLGLPMFQAMGDDEVAPQTLLEATHGYVFNAKLPIGVDKTLVSRDSSGQLRDAFGNIVEIITDPYTRQETYVVKMTMIEAATRYLREWVDTTFMLLPFDPEIFSDMQGETEQRVKAMAATQTKKKYNAFHILDAMRAFAMARMEEEIHEQVSIQEAEPVLAKAVDLSAVPEMLRQ
jgi:hypothetical protein